MIACSKTEVKFANTLNIPLFQQYTHSNFLNRIQKTSPELIRLLNTIFDAISAAKCLNFDSMNASTQVLTNTSLHEITLDKAKATIVAVLAHFSNPCFSWEYASVISVAMRCFTSCRTIQDLLSCIAPTACGGKTSELRLVKSAQLVKAEKTNNNYGSMTIRVYDNAPTRKKYIWKPTEAPDTDNVDAGSSRSGYTQCHAQAVVTAQLRFLIWEKDAPNLQNDIQYAPKFDKPLLNRDGSLHHDVPLDRFLPKLCIEDPEEDGTESEVQALNSEVSAFDYLLIQNELKHKIWPLMTDNCVARIAASAVANSVANTIASNGISAIYFVCNLCGHIYQCNQKRSCTDGCHNSTAILEKFVNGNKVLPDGAKKTIFNSHAIPIAPPKVGQLISNNRTHPPILESQSLPTTIPVDEMRSQPHQSPLFLQQSLIHEYYCKIPTNRCITESLLPLPYTPSGIANIRFIYETIISEFGEYQKWGEICADIGATHFATLESFGILRFRQPSGHEGFAVDHALMKMLWEAGFEHIAELLGFKTQKASGFFMLGTLTHIVRELYRIVRKVLGIMLFNVFRQDKLYKSHTELDFYNWRHDNEANDDYHFRNIVFLYDRLLPANDIYLKGIRVNMKTISEGGRKVVLPLFGPLGYLPYFKAVIRDLYEEWRWKDPYRKWRKRFFTFGVTPGSCQSVDFLMEQAVASFIATGVNNNEDGPEVATLLMSCNRPIIATAFKEGGKKKEPIKYNQPRTHREYEKVTEEFLQWMLVNVDLRKVPGRRTIKTINQAEEYYKDTDLISLYNRGVNDINAYIASGFRTIPKRITLRTDKAQAEAEALTEEQHSQIVEESEPSKIFEDEIAS